jgi:hypothetical protein
MMDHNVSKGSIKTYVTINATIFGLDRLVYMAFLAANNSDFEDRWLPRFLLDFLPVLLGRLRTPGRECLWGVTKWRLEVV